MKKAELKTIKLTPPTWTFAVGVYLDVLTRRTSSPKSIQMAREEIERLAEHVDSMNEAKSEPNPKPDDVESLVKGLIGLAEKYHSKEVELQLQGDLSGGLRDWDGNEVYLEGVSDRGRKVPLVDWIREATEAYKHALYRKEVDQLQPPC